jgi:hypothetical protein
MKTGDKTDVRDPNLNQLEISMKKLSLKLAVVALSLTALSGTAYAGSVQSGTLVCELRGKTNLILYSKRKFDCRFDPAGSRAVESYGGEITNIGADLEVTKTEQIVWLVFAPSANIPAGALAGSYVGGGASAAFGVGLGARAMIGGSENSIALQPLSMSGSTGFGASAGISGLTLTHIK